MPARRHGYIAAVPRLHPIALTLLLLAAACSRAQPAAPVPDGPIDPHRIALPDPEPTPANADGRAQWSMAGSRAVFAVPGADPLLTLACQDHRLVITRPIAAEVGAGALFAIEGPRRIVRVPVDATPMPGRRGYVWQGSVDGASAENDVFAGPFTGTLPGGGLIKVSAGAPAAEIVRQCRKG